MAVRSRTATVPPTFADRYQTPHGVAGWFAAVSHKRIGARFIVTAFAFLLIGAIEGLLLRTQLAEPANGLLNREAFDRVFTLHGTTMVFLFALPVLLGIAIYVVPLTIGARDLPLPRLAQFSYWCYLAGGLFLYVSTIGGAIPDAGSSSPVPLSGPVYSPSHAVDVWLSGTVLVEVAVVAASIALFAGILTTRAPGMTLWRMPLIAWSALVTSVLVLVGVAPLLVADLMLGSDRTFGTWFFEQLGGGSPLLWHRLWWIGGIPQVALLLAVPGVGIASQIVESSAGRPLAGRSIVMVAIAVLATADLAVWIAGNRAGDGVGGPQIVPTIFALIALIPFATIFVSWGATIWDDAVLGTSAVGFVIGGAVLGMLGVASCALVLLPPFAEQLHGSQFAVGAMHLLLFGAVVFPVLAALSFWFPTLTGRLIGERAAFISAAVITVGVALTFVPLLLAGLLGMPRRIATYPNGTGWTLLNLSSTIGAYVLVAGVCLWISTALVGAVRGRAATENPWNADGLEWRTASPPPAHDSDRPPLAVNDDQLDDGWRGAALLADRLDAGPADARATLATSAVAARPTGIAVVGGPTILPILVVFGLVVVLAGMSTMSVWTTWIGAGLSTLFVLLWLSARSSARTTAAAFADVDPALVGAPGPSLAGAVAALIAGASLLLGLVLAETFLWSQAPVWPPLVNTAYPPTGGWAVAAVICAAAGAVVAWLPVAASRRRRSAAPEPSMLPSRVTLALSALLSVAAIACWVAEGFAVDFEPSSDAYTASFFLFLTVAVAASVVAIVAVVVAIARLRAPARGVRISAATAATFAGAAAAVAWVMVVLIPQLTARA